MNKFEFNTEVNDSQVKLYYRELIYGGYCGIQYELCLPVDLLKMIKLIK